MRESSFSCSCLGAPSAIVAHWHSAWSGTAGLNAGWISCATGATQGLSCARAAKGRLDGRPQGRHCFLQARALPLSTNQEDRKPAQLRIPTPLRQHPGNRRNLVTLNVLESDLGQQPIRFARPVLHRVIEIFHGSNSGIPDLPLSVWGSTWRRCPKSIPPQSFPPLAGG